MCLHSKYSASECQFLLASPQIQTRDVLYIEMFSLQAEDLSMGRRTVIQSPTLPPSCQFQTPQLFYPEGVTSQFNHCSKSESSSSLILSDVIPRDQGKQTEVVTKHWNKDLPAPLELVLNVKSDCFSTGTAMPQFLKAATTSTYQCYIAPVCATS